MRLWAFAITTYRHFTTEAAASDRKKCAAYNFFKNKKKGVSGSKGVTGSKGLTGCKTWKKPKEKPKVNLTAEQKQVLDAVCDGKSVFITGSAGTGKTYLHEAISRKLKKIYGKSKVYVTASTGIAACLISGQTLHSFAGIGLGNVDRNALLERILLDERACNRWRKVKALIIDEISMIDAELFEGLALIARTLRDGESVHGNKTWGGIQLIVSGDFFQLPPVSTKKHKKLYAFEADCWNSSFDQQFELTTVFRQSDLLLVHLLQEIRKGGHDPDMLMLLEGCCSGYEPDPASVKLFPRLEDVNKVNKEKLESLNEEIYIYKALDSGQNKGVRQLKNGIAPDELKLCVGAKVMLTKNLNPYRRLVNGATGTIVKFQKYSEDDFDIGDMCSHGNLLPLVKFDSGIELTIEPDTWEFKDGDKVVACRKQIPLILSWAISIHKCQGMTIDNLHTNLSRSFGCGMVYVALSRVRSLKGLHISGLESSSIKAHPKVLEFYQGFSQQHENKNSLSAGEIDKGK